MVQRLARGPFKAEIRVRFPLALNPTFPLAEETSRRSNCPQLRSTFAPIESCSATLCRLRFYPPTQAIALLFRSVTTGLNHLESVSCSARTDWQAVCPCD